MNREEILMAANQCVNGERDKAYGSPEDNFGTIAELWSVYKNIPFSPVDVAMMMALLKIARIRTGVMTSDSFVDLAGYAACGGEIATLAIKPDEIPTVLNTNAKNTVRIMKN